jgi:uncharacterized RDD family membrane protein YckC
MLDDRALQPYFLGEREHLTLKRLTNQLAYHARHDAGLGLLIRGGGPSPLLDCVGLLQLLFLGGCKRRIDLAPSAEVLIPMAHTDRPAALLVAQHRFDRVTRVVDRPLVHGVGEERVAVVGQHDIVAQRGPGLALEVAWMVAHTTEEPVEIGGLIQIEPQALVLSVWHHLPNPVIFVAADYRDQLVMRTRRGGLRVAPISRRLLASLIDVTLALLAAIIAIGAYTGAAAMLGSKEARGVRSLSKLTGSKRVRITLRVCAFLLNVLLTGRRGPGSRIVGIRLVDARTGGPVSLTQATLRTGVRQGWELLAKRLTTRLGKPEQLKQPDLRSEIEALRREHGDDRDALRRAMKKMYEENQVRPYKACLPALMQLPLGLAIESPALWTPLHQGLPDKLAGTIVISDR